MRHRFFGWPGAWCLDCGCEDPMETAVADGKITFNADNTINIDPSVFFPPCPSPGSNRFNPYVRKEENSNDRS